SNLSSIVDTYISRRSLIGLALIIIFFSIFIGCLIVLFTPIHTLLPGYLKENQRTATEENLLRLDSLASVYETNQRFIDNYLRITDIDRAPVDSSALYADTVPLSNDSLIAPSSRERSFVAKMEEQERFNISVLAPLAADGMIFSDISDTGIFSSTSKDKEVGEVILSADASIISIAEGTVIDSFYSNKEKGFVIIIQHPKGFVSRYSSVGKPFVMQGEDVESGQIIASPPPADNKGRRGIFIRMWHNGLPLIPYKFIHERENTNRISSFGAENSFEAPRGK
ncbi:MAG: M23 family metallopeptidase, partial [Muribaculaceae bacterium]|nr:M23 family metallopeptidase [Muribaculaceae bacterium]